VPDVQRVQVGNGEQGFDVLQVESVSGIDLQSETAGLFGGLDETIQFPSPV